MYTISIDPGYRNLGIVVIDDNNKTIFFRKLYDTKCSMQTKSYWNIWFYKFKKQIAKLIVLIGPQARLQENTIICEKQKAHPFQELAGFIIGEISLYWPKSKIVWVDPRAVWKSCGLKSNKNRLLKKRLTINTINEYQDTNEILSDHEADCILNYYYHSGIFKSDKWRCCISHQQKEQIESLSQPVTHLVE
jgi:hypothetical protein